MVILVLGGSGSGKSAYAETAAGRLAEGMRKYYLATMQAFDKEGQKKIRRHRKLRSGKGFLTIEQPVHILQAAEQMEPGERTALLECMSNLAANEMFGGTVGESSQRGTPEAVSRRILKQVGELQKQLAHFVIVSNNVSEDGILYDEGTMNYLKALGIINQGLAVMADTVVEVVVGIPVVLKGSEGQKGGSRK